MADQTGSSGFDAGGDFDQSPADVLASLAEGPAAPAPEATDTPQLDDSSAEWADQSADQDTPKARPSTPAAPASLEVKGPKGVQKYVLDPADAKLKQALAMSQGFRPMQVERDRARAEAKALAAEVSPLREKAQVWDELQGLSQAGHTDRVVRAVLGEQKYAEYKQQVLTEASASPQERAALDRTRAEKDRDYERTRAEDRIAKVEARAQAAEDRAETDRLRGIGQSSLARHTFRGTLQDSDQAEALDQELWSSAWSKLEALADDGQDITQQTVERVFAQKAKLLRGGVTAAANTKVDQIVAGKKQAARQQAQVAATERYPTATNAPKVEGWNGRSMTDLVRRLTRT